MKKFTFTVDIVGDNADVSEIAGTIREAVASHGTYNCVDHVDTVEFTDQGLKVWAKRKIGLSLAAVKPKKAKAEKQTETAAS